MGTGIEVISAALIATFIAQLLKFIFYYIKNRCVNFKIFASTGGMPSSHSAAVVSTMTSVGLIEGFGSVDFSIALVFGLIVMYDAAGLRRAAGRQAACLNRILEDFYKNEIQSIGGKLKELLGHTPIQVFWGAVLGAVYAYYMHQYFLGLS